ncbi:TPA: NAD(P)H-dependent oxidoreductase [Streptococcus suis]|uniref:FMN-dependent NADH:quinone oxidoreductase n=6 Tax=Streptococcus suis TaxID=1307 RepID=AZOR_STRS2|nr:NAD(P)H-dependent oxidoreductase [Streptococcus suis]A4W2Z7.1 RecName: Full=FMN-dependent NADH:quinone oxidoreductase; AltName: Full=Azo-dye reductase; AltName: Full=FMN-dependent NADH-azo compound oxidoreductase; AltName: Full=FMN-dependent NADH-azoreductase [Streptococcus suis 98HAH33]ABP92736.1 Acyl carrier protein phosphodiesterase [Streptococcus suis 98HAH33]ADE31857.1 Acyl carrier protein phosphodiesterase [Streptococcus suis GZ1]ADV70596.1 Acyl carrier protein phosphodiesterase [Strep
MANLLIVKAHPLDAQKSYALRALEEFQTRYASLHPEDRIEIVDVFEDQIPALDKPLLEAMGAAKRGEAISPEQAEQLGRYNALTQQFLAADKIVVVNPLWNLNVPSQLVSWINTINVAGLTFKYGPEGSIGLVKGKKLLHIQSNGGVYAGQDPAAQYIKSIFEFLGFEDIHQVFIEGQSADPSQSQVIFEEAMAKIDQILESY